MRSDKGSSGRRFAHSAHRNRVQQILEFLQPADLPDDIKHLVQVTKTTDRSSPFADRRDLLQRDGIAGLGRDLG